MLIPISTIAVLNRQRKHVDPTELQSLASSIKDNGLLHPIVVRTPNPDEVSQLSEGQSHILCVGGRRLAAHILLGRTDIEVNFKEALDPIRARIVELEENLRRVNLTWQEETDARAEIAGLFKQLNPTANIRETADFVGVSASQLSKDLSLVDAVKADPSLKQASSKGSAIRTAEFKATVRDRISKAEKNISSALSLLKEKIVTADAREYIAAVPSQSIDMVFSDLPYGIDYFETTKAGEHAEAAHSHYDDSAKTTKDLIADLVPHFVRVVKPTGWIVLFMGYEWHGWLQAKISRTCMVHGGQFGVMTLDEGSYEVNMAPCTNWDTKTQCARLKPELKPWIWTRRGKGNHGHWPELHASSRYEMIVVVNGGSAKLCKKPVEDVLDFAPVEGARLHAMQKPHALCRELIERCTVVGEKVLDVTCGSGAHLAAAADLGRDFAGCDSNPNMLEPALMHVSQFFHRTKG